MSEFLVLCIGVLQIVAGIIVLVWAWPLFADPPFLSQGLVKEYHDLRQMLPRDDATLATLKGLRWKLEWLFLQQTEGVFFGMASGALLVMCGSALVGVACWPRVSRTLCRKR
ncbi:hypothetical protein J2X02_001764 [Pseudoxanthomonas japonensis]|uniref:hypothetical protein n=1 Tax=Pseudoxanthomonas TaxID=83618 RepID=UPI0007849F26|nr:MULTISPECIES: hypothetical protein [Pseudoxanthomonas]MBA3930070.1 hypothetical protein [Xanthomonas sp.]MDR7068913.1 hypothetical protein [Pseudoxanthomonas japonensis]